jgi:hypothetical protein
MASVALRDGELTQGLQLLGAVDRMLETAHRVLAPADERVRREALAEIQLRLDSRAFDAAFREGHAAQLEDLEAMAKAVSQRARGRGG